MLNGELVVLRSVRERDLAAFIDAHTQISNRGEFYPLGVRPESVLRRSHAETGSWERDEGTVLLQRRSQRRRPHLLAAPRQPSTLALNRFRTRFG
jgi:hypothetical protein